MDIFFKTIRNQIDTDEARGLSAYATMSNGGVRLKNEPIIQDGYRQNFALDADRILNANAYMRYIDKTQVFCLIKNDHITHRVLHVQLVSKIARTIGRFLQLNEDLIEAIALGHDIGHAPFGHDGEKILSQLCQNYGIGNFYHAVQSVIFLDQVERNGKGQNLCLQTLDGILCHDGEVHDRTLIPQTEKNFSVFFSELEAKTLLPETKLVPMSMEGCVMRFSDTIAYVGRDIEDAIRLGLIKKSDIPLDCVKVLGDTNGKIVYNLVTDLIKTSFQKPYIGFSDDFSNALQTLKEFNYSRIYHHPKYKSHLPIIKNLFTMLFEKYLNDLETQNYTSVIYHNFLKNMDNKYIENRNHPTIIRDFLAGMTDQYFLNQCPVQKRPPFYETQSSSF